ncbi:MAG: hypothetical protein LBU87_01030 [Lactobacillales bacterium]|jgi:hypothetical protein|nr:hypothetical protein [Lactobacillales bacterium]
MLTRKFEESNPDLAQRIIRAAYAIPQRQKNVSWWGAFKSLFQGTYMPMPTLALPALFALGIFLSIGLAPAYDITEYANDIYLSL